MLTGSGRESKQVEQGSAGIPRENAAKKAIVEGREKRQGEAVRERVVANPSRVVRTGKSNNARPTTPCETLPGDKCPMRFPRRVLGTGRERGEGREKIRNEARGSVVRFRSNGFLPFSLSLFFSPRKQWGRARNNELPFSRERYTR